MLNNVNKIVNCQVEIAPRIILISQLYIWQVVIEKNNEKVTLSNLKIIAYLASPRKSSAVKWSLSFSLIKSSDVSSEMVKMKLSFHSGSLPASNII
jgi:hypothetical protein